MKFSNVLFLTSLLGMFSYNALANVTVHVRQQQLEFTELPRLNDVLQQVRDTANIYWPTAALFRDSESLVLLQQKTVADLRLLAELTTDNLLADSAKKLATEIENWLIAQRSEYKVHYERAGLELSLNPRLSQGTYYLAVPARSTQLAVFGATDSRTVTFAFAQQVAAVYQQHALAIADKNEIWVIAPDGTLSKVGVAYWNKQHANTRPGQQFYIPFAKNKLPTPLKDLNDNIVTLLRHRVISE